jgi:spermidine/putrescine transport system permease protein
MRVKRRAVLLLTLLIIPFWVSYLLRIISWKIILGSNGALNSLLASLGLVDESAAVLLYSRSAVIVTLVYLWLPFAALPIYAALLRIDRSLLEAAADLGATPAQRFRRITLPLALPGILVAFFMVFIPTVGEYLTPLLVGGDEGTLYGNIINLFFAQGTNWPQGSALALIMLAAIGVVIAVLARVVGLRRVVEEL